MNKVLTNSKQVSLTTETFEGIFIGCETYSLSAVR